jgi:hypothetical protein
MNARTLPKLLAVTALAVAALGSTPLANAGLGIPQGKAPHGIRAPEKHPERLGIPQKHPDGLARLNIIAV